MSASARDDGPEPGHAAPGDRLTREVVVRAAVDLVDRQGLRELSMRRLGATLGVEAMSLYRYVDGREDLLDAVIESVVGELSAEPDEGAPPGDGWQGFLQHLAHSVRRVALSHPQLFPLLATRHPAAPWIRPPLRSLDWIETFLRGLTTRGFSDASAVSAYRAFTSFLLGHLLLEVSSRADAPMPVDGVVPETSADTEDVDLADYPCIAQLQHLLRQDHSRSEFEESLENLLDRIERMSPA